MGYSGAGGETDSWKKPEAKNLVTLSLLIIEKASNTTLAIYWGGKGLLGVEGGVISNNSKNMKDRELIIYLRQKPSYTVVASIQRLRIFPVITYKTRQNNWQLQTSKIQISECQSDR